MQCNRCFAHINTAGSYCPRCGAPLSAYPPTPAPERVPVRKNIAPLSTTGLVITALISTLLLLFTLKDIFSESDLFSDFFAILGLVDKEFVDALDYLLYRALPINDIEHILNIFRLLGELPAIAAVISMWFIFGAISGREFKPGMFCGSISLIKFFHIFSLILAILPTIVVAISPILLDVSSWPDSLSELFGVLYFVSLLVLIFIILYRSAIVRLLTALQNGARSGHYQSASGFLIFCLFVAGIVNTVTGMLGGIVDFDGIIELMRNALLPLIHAICLCIYNSRRHQINRY